MPKIALKNGETGEIEEFEPVDAREILATPGTAYSVPNGAADLIGLALDPGTRDISIPQLQGADVEMQTGLSEEKYARAAVVKAQPGDPSQTRTVVRADTDDGKAPEARPASPVEKVREKLADIQTRRTDKPAGV